MSEIKKTLATLKARWFEAALIIGIKVLLVNLNKLLRIGKSELTPILILLSFILTITLIVIWMLLNFGFQRTVYLEGDKQQSPIVLLKTGMLFLGRMFILVLLWLVIYYVLVWLTFSITKPLTSTDTSFFETAQSSPLLYQFYFTVPSLILIKPVLLIPALIIVLNCKVLESFKFLKKCRLFDAKGLLTLFVIATAFSFLGAFLLNLNEIGEISLRILITVYSIVGSFIGLMIAVTAVRFVASLNLVYDVQPVEDSQKYTNGNLEE